MSKLKELVIYDIDGDTVSRDTFLYVNELKEQNEKLKKCAEFYANRFSWNFSKHDTYENYAGEIKNDESLVQYKEKDGDIFEDYCGGKLARLTLKEIEESK